MFKIMKKVALVLCLVLAVSTFVRADDSDVALVLKTNGAVQLKKNSRSQWANAKRGQRLDSGQAVRTGNNSLAALVFTDDKTLLKVRANSNVTIQGKREKAGIIKRIRLGFGQIWAKVTKQNTAMRVESPSGVATVKGTVFNCLVTDDAFFVFCQEGLMEVLNQFGTMLLGANEMARLTKNSGPERVQGNPSDIFELEDDAGTRQLEIELDKEGEKKKLILEFGGNQ